MADNTAWGPSKRWHWGDYDRYQLSYYSNRRTGTTWTFSVAGSGSHGGTPWTAVWRGWRFYRSQRRPS